MNTKESAPRPVFRLERDERGFAKAISANGRFVLQLNPGTTTNEEYAQWVVDRLNGSREPAPAGTEEAVLTRLTRIEALASLAAAGPWEHVWGPERQSVAEKGGEDIALSPRVWDGELSRGWTRVWADFEFIASAREDVPWLCKTVRGLLYNKYLFPADGVWLHETGPNRETSTRIAKLGELPDPIRAAEVARHLDLISKVIVEGREQGLSAHDVALRIAAAIAKKEE